MLQEAHMRPRRQSSRNSGESFVQTDLEVREADILPHRVFAPEICVDLPSRTTSIDHRAFDHLCRHHFGVSDVAGAFPTFLGASLQRDPRRIVQVRRIPAPRAKRNTVGFPWSLFVSQRLLERRR